MKLKFHKYHGTGNDFILIDNRESRINLTRKEIAHLCNRHYGIGADGLMLLTTRNGYDFGMVYYNSDGNESTMCGNGGRCMTAFARSLGIIEHTARFLAIDGEHTAEILKDDSTLKMIKLRMSDVPTPPLAPPQQGRGASNIEINTGSPHLVIFVDNLSALDAVAEGRKLRNNPRFAPDGINVDFVEIRDNVLFVRTYERGVENETLSCGTGVTAAALAYARIHTPPPAPPSLLRFARKGRGVFGIRHQESVIHVETRGGLLTVYFREDGDSFRDIWLEGPAEFVFQGDIRF